MELEGGEGGSARGKGGDGRARGERVVRRVERREGGEASDPVQSLEAVGANVQEEERLWRAGDTGAALREHDG